MLLKMAWDVGKGRTGVGHTSTEGDQMCLLEAEIQTLMVDLFTQI